MIQMDPNPGWTHLSSSKCVKNCFSWGNKYHSTLTLSRFMPGGDNDLKNEQEYDEIYQALGRIELALVNKPGCVLKVSKVNEESSVVTIRDCAPLRKVWYDIKKVRGKVGDHWGGLTVSL